jgi:hypothetical protein
LISHLVFSFLFFSFSCKIIYLFVVEKLVCKVESGISFILAEFGLLRKQMK